MDIPARTGSQILPYFYGQVAIPVFIVDIFILYLYTLYKMPSKLVGTAESRRSAFSNVDLYYMYTCRCSLHRDNDTI